MKSLTIPERDGGAAERCHGRPAVPELVAGLSVACG